MSRDSTASAVRSTANGRSLRSVEENSLRTKSAGVCRPGGRPTPNRDSIVVTGAKRFAQRLEPVVAVVAAAELAPQYAEVDVQLVVQHDQVGRLHLEELQQPGDRAAGLVHVRAGLGQDRPRMPLIRVSITSALACLCCFQLAADPGRPARRRPSGRCCAGSWHRKGRDSPARRPTTRRPPRIPALLLISGAAAADYSAAAATGSSAAVGSSRSMPASASASASSASACSAVCAAVTLTIRVSGSMASVVPAGSLQVGRVDLGAGVQALDGDGDAVGDVGRLGLDQDGLRSRARPGSR